MAENRYTSENLHQETARVCWQELETHFARGMVIRVASELDLVEVATRLANDDKAAVEKWLGSGQIEHLSTEVAKDWNGRDPELWCVVVSPWVVVQERTA
ncbi:MAG: DUF2288 domain-containing protein [Gammaproteobacteria bacterium]|nr:MAG: DUF2288 domain-containing protein [Gammaproteobacteria bacterium]